MVLYILFSILLCKAFHYPILYRAYSQTRSMNRKRQMVIVFTASLISDLLMLGVILNDTVNGVHE